MNVYIDFNLNKTDDKIQVNIEGSKNINLVYQDVIYSFNNAGKKDVVEIRGL